MKKQRRLSNKRNNDLIAHPYLWRYIDRFLNEKRWQQVERFGIEHPMTPCYLKRLDVWTLSVFSVSLSDVGSTCKFINLGEENG